MIGQWFINEVRETFEKVNQRIEGWAKSQVENAEEIKKLKGELMAMKARMGRVSKPEK